MQTTVHPVAAAARLCRNAAGSHAFRSTPPVALTRRHKLGRLARSAAEPSDAASAPAPAPGPAAPAPTPAAAAAPAVEEEPETVFYEGSGGAPAELAISILLGFTLLYLPLTIASIGRRLWVSYKITNKRIIVKTDSPVFQREIQVSYRDMKEIRTAPRGFGLWGDMVIFLKDGSRLEVLGIERVNELREYMLGRMLAEQK